MQSQMKTAIGKNFSKFCTKTSIHGVGFWADSNRKTPSRLCYFLIWFSFLIATVILIYQNVVRYLEFNVKVSMTMEYPAELTFPSVTICPCYTWRKSRIGADAAFLDEMFPGDNRRFQCYNASGQIYNISENSYWDYGNRIRDGFDFIWAPFDRMFRSCYFLDEELNCADLFFGHLTSYGRCFTFNFNGDYDSSERSLVWIYSNQTQKNLSVKSGGLENSLRLLLDLQLWDYCMGSTKYGFYISLHDPAMLPPFMDRTTMVSPGFSTEIVVSEKRIDSRAVETLGTCKSTHFLPLYPNVSYTKENCFLQCLSEEVFQQCNCLLRFNPLNLDQMADILSSLYPDVKVPPEYGLKFLPCFISKECEENITAGFRRGKRTECLSKCPDPCLHSVYGTKNSMSPFISEELSVERLRNLTDYGNVEEMRKNLAEVSIYFEGIYVTQIVETRDFGPLDLFSNIGGTVGLFLGASLFSIVELFYLCWGLAESVCPSVDSARRDIARIGPRDEFFRPTVSRLNNNLVRGPDQSFPPHYAQQGRNL